MSTDDLESAIEQDVRTSQLICLALCLGPIILAAVATLVLAKGEPDAADPTTPVALLLGLSAVASHGVIAAAAAKPGVRQWTQSGEGVPRLARVHLQKTIIALAVCEGAAFINLIFYAVFNPSPWLLAMAALLIALNASKFPTVSGVADWCRAAARQSA